jgi:hypothetical protein
MRLAVLLFPLLVGCSAVPGPATAPPTPADTVEAHDPAPEGADPEELRREILRMAEEDAEDRSRLADHPPDGAAFRGAVERLEEGDRDRAARLRAIVADHGVPLPEEIGESALSAFLGLVLRQTVPADLQDEVLRRLQVEQRRGGVGGGTLAIFTDQLRMLRDEPQLYGTQLLMDLETGFLRPYPIEDEEGVDERRRELGLGPFADYLRRMRARVDGS